MQLIRHLASLPAHAKGAAIALGNFDGLHLGHRTILEETLSQARTLGVASAVMTFEPHPREFFKPDAPALRLMRLREKIAALRGMGFEYLFMLRFDQALAATSADDFIRRYLAEGLAVRHVTTGDNFHFGAKRSGSSATLAQAALAHGFSYKAIVPVCLGAQTISSSAIRSLLAEGAPERVMPLLGRSYTISGHVQHGDKRGRTLGFPTANIALGKLFIPKLGVYAIRARVQGRDYTGVANIGINPMFPAKQPRLEAHLFDFPGDIYGKLIEVELRSYLREEKTFASESELIQQMQKDVEQAR